MNPFSQRTLIAIFSLGLVTFLLGFVLAAFVGDLYGDLSADHSSYSRSLVGHRALAELLRRTGVTVIVSRNPGLTTCRPHFPLLLLEPARCVDARDRGEEPSASLERLLAVARDAETPVVLALPKRAVVPSLRKRGWIERERLLRDRQVEERLPKAVREATGEEADRVQRPGALSGFRAEPLGIETPRVEIEDPQVLAPAIVRAPLLRCREGVLIGRVTARGDRAPVYVVSDPDLFNNRGLGRGDHAALVHGLITKVLHAEGVVIDESLHGFTSGGTFLARALSFPMVLILLHGLLAAGLLAWSVSPRFGKALSPPPELPPGKALLLENTGKLLLAAGDHRAALRRYLAVSMADVAERFSLSEGTSKRDLMGRMKSLTAMRDLPFELDRILEAAREPTLGPGDALKLARRVHAWRRALAPPSQVPAPPSAAARPVTRSPA
jgi:hypothetical protein